MRFAIALLAVWTATSPVMAESSCRFTYTDALRQNVVEPEIKRLKGDDAARYDATQIQIMQRERMIDPHKETVLDNKPISISILGSGIDADSVIVQVEPCTSKLISSTVFDAFPEMSACPAGSGAPPGAWCVPDAKPHS